nr:N-formylglutamate amidohydrolase [Nocardia bovistercoris]
MDDEQALAWDLRERKYRANDYYGEGRPAAIDILDGSTGLLVTAPHSLHHFRHGRKKPADRYTGSYAELLHAALDATAVIPTGPIGRWENWEDRDDPFRHALDRLSTPSTLVVDLHGMSDRHGVDVCLGLGPAPTAASEELAHRLAEELHPYQVSINTPFAATPHYTVTAYVQTRTPADAIQIEMAANIRNPVLHPKRSGDFLGRLIRGLERFRT